MNKKAIVSISLIVVFMIIGILVYGTFYYVKPIEMLNGTFVNQDIPYNYLIFDQRDNQTFYYVGFDEKNSTHGSTVDQGTYTESSDGVYLLNSDKLKNIKLSYGKKKLEIKIDGNNYTFNQIHSEPVIMFK